ncbi:MAG: AAA family ATPase [Thermodesulfobacteriota bacterium]
MNAPAKLKMPFDLAATQRFLEALTGEADPRVTFQTFDDDKGRKDGSLACILHGTLGEHAATLQALNERGAGIFATVNETDLKGRSKGNIVCCRAIWQDDDKGAGWIHPTVEPNIVVATSPGKFQRYILTSTSQIDEHAGVMRRMVADHGCDPGAQDVGRVLRLPGFWHMKNRAKPFMVRIVGEINPARFSWDEVVRAFPPIATTVREKPACDLDLEHNVARATRYLLEEAEEAIEGASGDAATYRVACRVRDFGVSQGKALDLMLEHWNPAKAAPPWHPDDLARKVANAYRYAQDKTGRSTPDAMFPDSPGDAPEASPTATKRRFRSAAALCQNVKPPRWIIKRYIEEETTTVWFGDQANFKSFVALDLGVAIASGQQWAGEKTIQGPTAILCGEGHGGVARRIRAACIKRDLDPAVLPLFVSESAEDLGNPSNVAQIIADLKALTGGKLALLVIDTLASQFGQGDENSTRDMNLFLANVTKIRKSLSCSALIIHHSGHNSKERGRGSSALDRGVDSYSRVERRGMQVVLRSPGKMKDGEPFRDQWFLAHVVQVGLDEDLNPVTSLAIHHTPEVVESPAAKLGENQQFIVGIAKQGATEDAIKAAFQEWKGEGYKRQVFHKALKQLKDDGLLTQKPDGTWHSAIRQQCQQGVSN